MKRIKNINRDAAEIIKGLFAGSDCCPRLVFLQTLIIIAKGKVVPTL
jgi:hypothetical protein